MLDAEEFGRDARLNARRNAALRFRQKCALRVHLKRGVIHPHGNTYCNIHTI